LRDDEQPPQDVPGPDSEAPSGRADLAGTLRKKKSNAGRRLDKGVGQRVCLVVENDTYLWYKTVSIWKKITMQELMEKALEDFKKVG